MAIKVRHFFEEKNRVTLSVAAPGDSGWLLLSMHCESP